MSPVTAAARQPRQAPAGGGGFPRLLPPAGQGADLRAHLALHRPVPYRDSAGALIAEVRAAGLTGRGGAAFPVHRKLEAVAAARPGRAVVVGNAAEGEPASHKDEALLFLAPHLILDGLQLAAEAVGAGRAVLYVRGDLRARTRLDDYLPERDAYGLDRLPVEIVWSPHRFLAGEESALASRVSGGPALRQASGSVDVAEAAIGTPLATLLDLSAAGAVLVGGYHGAWLPVAQAAGLTLSNAQLRPVGAFAGAGVLAALPADRCGLLESARVARYLALESAGQCGPCLNGLPSIAAAMAELADNRPHPRVLDDLSRWAGLVEGRGACHHPDGTVRFLRSALRVFGP